MAKAHPAVDFEQPCALGRLEDRATDPEKGGRSPEKRQIAQRLGRSHQ
jgi:hypothetical protein